MSLIAHRQDIVHIIAMTWTSLKQTLDRSIKDHSGPIAYRTAARAITHIANNLSLTRQSRETESPAVMVILRGLLTARSAIDQFDSEIIGAISQSIIGLHKYQSSANSVSRVVRLSLNTLMPNDRSQNIESIRKSLQSAADLVKNVSRVHDDSTSYIEMWDSAEEDLDRLVKGLPLPPPLSSDFVLSRSWQRLESHLLAFDESWSVWLVWLRFRIFGISTDDIPHYLWPNIERHLALGSSAFWSQSAIQINAAFASYIVKAVDEAVEQEALREQSAFGLVFEIGKLDAKIDINESSQVGIEAIHLPVSREVVRHSERLLDICDGNSSARLREHVVEYLDILNDGEWKDDMLLVMRGDILRKELAFEEAWTPASDYEPLNQPVRHALDQIVRLHNVLINSHENLARVDKMLLGPDSTPERSTLGELKLLISSVEHDNLLTERARNALAEVSRQTEVRYLDDRQTARGVFSGNNLVRTIVGFLWQNKKKVGALPAFYGLGHWALMNEVTLLSYFSNNPVMRILLTRLLEYLKLLPLS